MILNNEIEEAREYIKEHFKIMYEVNNHIKAYLDALEFIKMIDNKELMMAIEFSTNQLHRYVETYKDIKIPSISQDYESIEIRVADLTALLCYSDPSDSELSYLLTSS